MNTIPIIFLILPFILASVVSLGQNIEEYKQWYEDRKNTTQNNSSNSNYNLDKDYDYDYDEDYNEDYDENIRSKGENDMRILTKMDEDGTNEIISIIDANYDDNIYDAKDKNKKVEGFLFMTADEEMYAIPEMSQATCNSICQELLIRGYADLTTYKPYEEI